MGAIGHRIPNALNNRKTIRRASILKRSQGRMQPELVIELDHVARGNPKFWTRLGIELISIRNHGIESIVATRKLDDDQDALGIRVPVLLLGKLAG